MLNPLNSSHISNHNITSPIEIKQNQQKQTQLTIFRPTWIPLVPSSAFQWRHRHLPLLRWSWQPPSRSRRGHDTGGFRNPKQPPEIHKTLFSTTVHGIHINWLAGFLIHQQYSVFSTNLFLGSSCPNVKIIHGEHHTQCNCLFFFTRKTFNGMLTHVDFLLGVGKRLRVFWKEVIFYKIWVPGDSK